MSKKSAVVVLHEQSCDSLILTKRSLQLRHHPGEFCFPGGRWERGDINLWSTALRELHEELGIASSRVKFIMELQPEQTLIGTTIYPWFATIPTLKPYEINKNEVSDVITLPMAEVTKLSNYQEIAIKRHGKTFSCWQFTASEQFVWGATARIMRQLCYTKPAR
ncbi:NUDIX hydrolase [Legionella oakridgensis]|uniref:NTP pyrophosphohydrolase including oxidative damage repair enzyme n=2 Tax=Legionella oakridgensis TaxID=29423 RepID=W0BB54_9GAMM|nr:CoA pyrophosphatase [Legionella oakridgensis]AHE67095.1 NTP pyrophosphohydrolase including oxidative damage repair enzyme [Legionella oakridgensis ATCC 33761 = DSM 21215]ETO93275.1 NTP pyrophosphohydrolase including oxidative damage repair enzyme [Legionella oakridgensis RV-2-2007]KTD44445.1 MutT/nudix family transporter protein [Legionella oakridgensis]STY20186.1 MutT/nudix family transporter protein [Legionella longbeachae]